MTEQLQFEPKTGSSLFSKQNLKSYLYVLLSLFGITGIYYLFNGPSSGMPNQEGNMPPGGNPPPTGDQTPPTGDMPLPPTDGTLPTGEMNQAPNMLGGGMNSIWPLWGSFVQITGSSLFWTILLFAGFLGLTALILKKAPKSAQLPLLVMTGLALMIGTNMLHGWDTGIVSAIGNPSEIYTDAIQVQSILQFISNYTSIQESLTVHAQTQPPGAVLLIYVLYVIFQEPASIAIALATISTVFSSLFLYGIFKRWFTKEQSDYSVFLFLLLPAIQVYYLANVYGMVATLILGFVYFYFHPNRAIKWIGTTICLFLATFISFLSAFVLLCMFLYEAFVAIREGMLKKDKFQEIKLRGWIGDILRRYQTLIISVGLVVGIYIGLYLGLGFNYLEAFSFASTLENPGGFMLFTDPGNYFVTRLQDILDILFFFGPILIVLCYRGLRSMKNELKGMQPGQTVVTANGATIEEKKADVNSYQKYYLVLAALVALGLMFLAGAPKKGETARICMFILPFLLIGVMEYLRKENFSTKDRLILLSVVFAQTLVFQLIGTYIW